MSAPRILITACLGLATSCASTASSLGPDRAGVVRQAPRFVPGDVFDVRVFDEEQLSGQFQVQEDGTIEFPLLGRLKV